MYNSAGALVPIELNTNVGMDRYSIEEYGEIFNLGELSSFIVSNGFTKVTYMGAIDILKDSLQEVSNELNIEFVHIPLYFSVTVPDIDDSATHLIIRSSYDSTAIVDEEYCKVKTNFLELIKTQSFGAQFAYYKNGDIVSNITSIPDNGEHPNFILKATLPAYNRDIYPKLYRVTNRAELDVVLQNVTEENHLVEFHFNPNKLYQNHIQIFRSFNLLFPPDLQSIPIGKYTKLTPSKLNTNESYDVPCEYDPETYELLNEHRLKYITSDGGIVKPKLLDTDQIEMADCTFKSAVDLQVGDMVKTIDVYNPNNVDVLNIPPDYGIGYSDFVSGSTYSENKIISKTRVDKVVDYVTITFSDGTTWEDTSTSAYLVLKENGDVGFGYLDKNDVTNGIKVGESIILVQSDDCNNLITVLKEIADIQMNRQIFGGWEIEVETLHVFLTKSENSTSSFVAIEHNAACVTTCTHASPACLKPNACCATNGACTGAVACMAYTDARCNCCRV
mgnify:CR=1 FL=1